MAYTSLLLAYAICLVLVQAQVPLPGCAKEPPIGGVPSPNVRQLLDYYGARQSGVHSLLLQNAIMPAANTITSVTRDHPRNVLPRQAVTCASGSSVCGSGCIGPSSTCCANSGRFCSQGAHCVLGSDGYRCCGANKVCCPDGNHQCETSQYCYLASTSALQSIYGCCLTGQSCSDGLACASGRKICLGGCIPSGDSCCPDGNGCPGGQYCSLATNGLYYCCSSGSTCYGTPGQTSFPFPTATTTSSTPSLTINTNTRTTVSVTSVIYATSTRSTSPTPPTTAVSSTSTSVTAGPITTTASGPTPIPNHRMSTGAIIGISVGATAGAFILLALLFYCCRKHFALTRRRQSPSEPVAAPPHPALVPAPAPEMAKQQWNIHNAGPELYSKNHAGNYPQKTTLHSPISEIHHGQDMLVDKSAGGAGMLGGTQRHEISATSMSGRDVMLNDGPWSPVSHRSVELPGYSER